MARVKRTRVAVKKNGDTIVVPSDIAREKAIAEVLELHLKGWSQYAIAAKLGVSQPTVCYDLKIAKERLAKEPVRLRDELVHEKLLQIAHRRQEAWAAWERSKAVARKRVHEESTMGDSYMSKDREELVDQVGDPRFLQIIGQCDADERALLGLDAPTKMDMSGTMLTLDYAAMMKREEAIIDPVEDRLSVEESKAKKTKGSK